MFCNWLKKPKNVVRQSIRYGKTHENLSKVIKMSRRRQENPNQKARQSRIYRLNQRHQKRFEAPLRQFIETKYKLIFEEYVDLYKRMDSQYPNRIDLRKTEMFKQWKQLNSQTNPDILTLAVRETIENENGTEQNGSEQDESELEAADQSESEQGER